MTQQTANVCITNDTGGTATVILFHQNDGLGTTQSKSWTLGPGDTSDALAVEFANGFGTADFLDYWSVQMNVTDGPNPGAYVTTVDYIVETSYWQECQLQDLDVGASLTFSISTSTFNIDLTSSNCSSSVTKVAPTSPITNVFVLMLENHSFDNMLAMSGISGITAATTSDSNSYNHATYSVKNGAPVTMPTDPGHEFCDVLLQLTGSDTYSGGEYPEINNSGFAQSYATSTSESPHQVPPAGDIGDIMACFTSADQVPVLDFLSAAFVVCDHWFSSMPGPTWPNRFFLHGASSSGFDDSPTSEQMAGWEVDGFQYPNGSIFDALNKASIPYRFYHDSTGFPDFQSLYSDDAANGSALGAVPQVSSLKGVELTDFNELSSFATDVAGPYPYPYTFIEPHYGDVSGGTYAGGSSQHPMDDVYGGENLLLNVVAPLCTSPIWNSSMLIVIYDEHGGFYDSVAPVAAAAPGDNPDYGYNRHGFNFTRLGVRVPSVIVSPVVGTGVDQTPYDHTSVLSLMEALWNLNPLTDRDANATSPLSLVNSPLKPSSAGNKEYGSPSALNKPAEPLTAATIPRPVSRLRERPMRTKAEMALRWQEHIPTSGNLPAALAVLRKADVKLAAGDPVKLEAARLSHASLVTRADAEAYARRILTEVQEEKAARRIVRRSPRQGPPQS